MQWHLNYLQFLFPQVKLALDPPAPAICSGMKKQFVWTQKLKMDRKVQKDHMGTNEQKWNQNITITLN